MNTEARWQDIEKKIHPAGKKTFHWIQYAAAVFICAGSVFFFYKVYQHNPKQLIAINKIQYPTQVIQQQPQQAAKVNNTKYPKSRAKNNFIPQSDPGKPTEMKKIQNTDSLLPQNNYMTQAQPVMQEPVHDLVPLIPGRPVIISIKKTTIKRFRVVHINELDKEKETLFVHSPLKKIPQPTDLFDEQPANQDLKLWWQSKPKPITSVTLTDHQ